MPVDTSCILSYLQRNGYQDIALFFVTDTASRFRLALRCGNIDVVPGKSVDVDRGDRGAGAESAGRVERAGEGGLAPGKSRDRGALLPAHARFRPPRLPLCRHRRHGETAEDDAHRGAASGRDESVPDSTLPRRRGGARRHSPADGSDFARIPDRRHERTGGAGGAAEESAGGGGAAGAHGRCIGGAADAADHRESVCELATEGASLLAVR